MFTGRADRDSHTADLNYSSPEVVENGAYRTPFSWRLFLLLTLAAYAVTTSWLLMIRDFLPATLILAHLTLGCAGITLGISDGFRPALTVFSIFNLCWLSIPEAFQIANRAAAWGDSNVMNARAEVATALALNAFSQAALLAGYIYRQNRPQQQHQTPRSMNPTIVRRAAIAALALSALLLPFVVSAAGGIGRLFASRNTLNEALTQSGLSLENAGGAKVAFFRIAPTATALFAALLLIQLNRRPSSEPIHRQIDTVLLFPALALLTCYANPLANSRFVALAAAGSLALLHFRPVTKVSAYFVSIMCFFAFLLVYPLADRFRGDRYAHAPGLGRLEVLVTKDFDGFQQVVNTVIYTNDVGHTHGRYSFSALLVMIPRSIWPGKANPASIDIAEHRNYWFTDLSLPIHSEFFLDFGWSGVLVIMCLLGVAWNWLDREWLGQTIWSPLAAYIAVAQIGMIRGPLGSLVPVYGPLVLGLLLTIGRAQRKAGPNSPPERKS